MVAFLDHRAAYFNFSDTYRRFQAKALDAMGLGPREHPFRILASGPCWQLREYSSGKPTPSLLIIASPIKRPYIWDLTPATSAIGYCLDRSLNVYLLEWVGATRGQEQMGLDEYAGRAVAVCVAMVTKANGTPPVLIGHSLGGTLAAIFCAYAPDAVRGLVLLGAPLGFEKASSRFRDALVTMAPASVLALDMIAGSLLSQASAAASPKAFVWERWKDAALSMSDPHAMVMHARIERWSLDEVALPSKLVDQVVGWLYRENRFYNGNLTICGRTIGATDVKAPVLAVVNRDDEVAPMAAVMPVFDRIATQDRQIVEYPGEVGVVFQHLGMLVGREAFAKTWPQIIAWIVKRG